MLTDWKKSNTRNREQFPSPWIRSHHIIMTVLLREVFDILRHVGHRDSLAGSIIRQIRGQSAAFSIEFSPHQTYKGISWVTGEIHLRHWRGVRLLSQLDVTNKRHRIWMLDLINNSAWGRTVLQVEYIKHSPFKCCCKEMGVVGVFLGMHTLEKSSYLRKHLLTKCFSFQSHLVLKDSQEHPARI